jgi:DNA-binding NarL/FixJ family response regulator
MAIPIALVEDDTGFAEALAEYFQISKKIVLCARFKSAEEAMESLGGSGARVVLVDINLPGMSGIELVGRLRETAPELLPLILTMYEESPLIFDALRAGACGYLLKRTPPAEIVMAIEQVAQGGSPMTPQIARQVVRFFHGRSGGQDPSGNLTEKEMAVLELLSQGLLYKEISDQLGITLDMVRNRIRKIYEKLHVNSRTDAVLKYLGRK